jgi:hypothetical protein
MSLIEVRAVLQSQQCCSPSSMLLIVFWSPEASERQRGMTLLRLRDSV